MSKAPSKKSIVFKLATDNLQSLPRQRSIAKTANAVTGTHIFGFQEADPEAYKEWLFGRWPHILGIGTPENPRDDRFSCPVGYNRAMFRPLAAESVKLYDGEGGISKTRHLGKVTFQHKGTGLVLAAVNLHSVVAHGSQRADRLDMKRRAKDVTKAEVRELLEMGLPVAVMGDFNDLANWFGTRFDDHRVTRVGKGIDQIILIDGDQHQWELLSFRWVKTPGDHDTLRAKVRLTER